MSFEIKILLEIFNIVYFITESTILTIVSWRRHKDIFTNHQSVSELNNDEAVYRIAPATPSLLNLFSLYFSSEQNQNFNEDCLGGDLGH